MTKDKKLVGKETNEMDVAIGNHEMTVVADKSTCNSNETENASVAFVSSVVSKEALENTSILSGCDVPEMFLCNGSSKEKCSNSTAESYVMQKRVLLKTNKKSGDISKSDVKIETISTRKVDSGIHKKEGCIKRKFRKRRTHYTRRKKSKVSITEKTLESNQHHTSNKIQFNNHDYVDEPKTKVKAHISEKCDFTIYEKRFSDEPLNSKRRKRDITKLKNFSTILRKRTSSSFSYKNIPVDQNRKCLEGSTRFISASVMCSKPSADTTDAGVFESSITSSDNDVSNGFKNKACIKDYRFQAEKSFSNINENQKNCSVTAKNSQQAKKSKYEALKQVTEFKKNDELNLEGSRSIRNSSSLSTVTQKMDAGKTVQVERRKNIPRLQNTKLDGKDDKSAVSRDANGKSSVLDISKNAVDAKMTTESLLDLKFGISKTTRNAASRVDHESQVLFDSIKKSNDSSNVCTKNDQNPGLKNKSRKQKLSKYKSKCCVSTVSVTAPVDLSVSDSSEHSTNASVAITSESNSDESVQKENKIKTFNNQLANPSTSKSLIESADIEVKQLCRKTITDSKSSNKLKMYNARKSREIAVTSESQTSTSLSSPKPADIIAEKTSKIVQRSVPSNVRARKQTTRKSTCKGFRQQTRNFQPIYNRKKSLSSECSNSKDRSSDDDYVCECTENSSEEDSLDETDSIDYVCKTIKISKRPSKKENTVFKVIWNAKEEINSKSSVSFNRYCCGISECFFCKNKCTKWSKMSVMDFSVDYDVYDYTECIGSYLKLYNSYPKLKVGGKSHELQCHCGYEDDIFAVFNVGGPIFAMDWLMSSNYPYILAVSTALDRNEYNSLEVMSRCPAAIQILNCKQRIPDLELMIVGDFGYVWSLAWLPFGSDNNFLGFLLAACSSGAAYVFKVPRASERAVISVRGKLSLTVGSGDCFGQCFALTYSYFDPNFICAGYAHGQIALFDVSEPLSHFVVECSEKSSNKNVYPTKISMPTDIPVKDLKFFPNSHTTVLISYLLLREVWIWNFVPDDCLLLKIDCAATELCCLPHSFGIAFATDYTSKRGTKSFLKYLNIPFKTTIYSVGLSFNTAIQSLHVSEFYDAIALCTASGSICVHKLSGIIKRKNPSDSDLIQTALHYIRYCEDDYKQLRFERETNDTMIEKGYLEILRPKCSRGAKLNLSACKENFAEHDLRRHSLNSLQKIRINPNPSTEGLLATGGCAGYLFLFRPRLSK